MRSGRNRWIRDKFMGQINMGETEEGRIGEQGGTKGGIGFGAEGRVRGEEQAQEVWTSQVALVEIELEEEEGRGVAMKEKKVWKYMERDLH